MKRNGKLLALLLALCVVIGSTAVFAEEPPQPAGVGENAIVETKTEDVVQPTEAQDADMEPAPSMETEITSVDGSIESELTTPVLVPEADDAFENDLSIDDAAQIVNAVSANAAAANVCTHESKDNSYVLEDKTYADIDDHGHTVSGTMVQYEFCNDCDERWEVGREPFTQRADHIFYNEKQCACGYENTCTHPRLDAGYEFDSGSAATYTDITATSHRVNGSRSMEYVCLVCGEVVQRVEAYPSEGKIEPHSISNGECERCGYKVSCDHSNKRVIETYFDSVGAQYTDLTETTHTVIGTKGTNYYCDDCGEYISEKEENCTGTVAHEFDGNVCMDCGYKSACVHENISKEYDVDWEIARYSRVNPKTHTATSTYGYVQTSCKDCGAILSFAKVNEALSVVQPHEFRSGRCVCGYEQGACAHEQTESWTNYANATYTLCNALGHTITGYKTVGYKCLDCGETWDGAPEVNKTSAFERHTYDEKGVCTECGYQNECPHNSVESTLEYANTEYSDGDAEGHTVCGYPRMFHSCNDCEAYWYDEPAAEKVTVREAHDFVDGACWKCKYQNTCTHEDSDFWTWYDDAEYFDITETGHTVRGHRTHSQLCNVCGEKIVLETEKELSESVEPHHYIGNVCYECGYENTCEHAHTESNEYYENVVYSNLDQTGHTVSGYLCISRICMDCGAEVSTDRAEERTEAREAHQFVNGSCENCGFKNTCKHADLNSYAGYWDEIYLNPTAEGHTVSGYECTFYYCRDCEDSWHSEPAAERSEKQEAHEFEGGACWKCGFKNPCKHAHVETYPGYWNAEYLNPTDEGHTVKGYVCTYHFCQDCQDSWHDEPASELTTAQEKHSRVDLEDGTAFCMECGYRYKDQPIVTDAPVATPTPAPTKKPGAKPTEQPVAADATATPAPTQPVYSEVPAGEAVHGVKAEDALNIAETAILVGDTLEGEGAAMEIVNMEKVVTAEEKAALDQLSMKERMLTFLSVIGFEEQVNRTLAERNEALSDEAQALKEQMQARIAGMSAEERAAFEALLMECFPQERIAVDGEEQIFFVLEIEVRAGENVSRERYGFRAEGEDWFFIRLEVA